MQLTEQNKATTLFSSRILQQQLKEYGENLQAIDTVPSLMKCIKESFLDFTLYYTTIADQEFCRIEENENVDKNEIYLLHYALSESLKDLAILHRDVLLQLQISEYKELEAVVSKEQIKYHFESSKQVLLKATQEFSETIAKERTAIYQSEKSNRKLLASITHRKNPWGIYKTQFETIKKQISDITNNKTAIFRTIKIFSDIKQHNTIFQEKSLSEIDGFKKSLGEAIRAVKELKEIEEIPQLITWIDTTVKANSKEENLQATYADIIELKIKSLSEQTVSVGTDNGFLLTKKVDFNKAVKKWFDFEILPSLIDVWESKSNMQLFFKHSLLNLKSSLIIKKNNNQLDAMPSQLQSLQNTHQTLSDNEKNIEQVILEVENKFRNQFKFSTIFDNEDFLEVSLQSSITNFASEQVSLFSNIKKKLFSRLAIINKKYDRSALFNTQNKVEEAIECINHRMFKENNAHYDTLFLNKNFIGDLFIMPRMVQEDKFDRSLEQWENGFNKAILVLGDSLSGTSTFVEKVANKHFKKNSIYLERDATITYGGRKFATTKDLKAALQNIKKGYSERRPLLIIDKLELWKDDNYSLLDNTRALLSFIVNESDNVLVAVITSKQMQSHLDKRLRFSETFSTTLNLNKAAFDEIYQAILLRHGASHKELVSPKGELLTRKQIEQNVLKLSRKLNYNIGEVLQAWTYGTTIVSDNKVVYEDRDTGFRDFFNTEEVIILKYILLYKNISEMALKNFVGPTLQSTYKSSLKRLTNTKVLVRTANGQLMLNSVVAMDVKRLLIYRGILN